MAYGNGNKDELKRSIVLGGALTKGKLAGLQELRAAFAAAANTFVHAAAVEDPLLSRPTADELETILCEAQKKMEGLNKAYCEKARILVKTNITQGWKRLEQRFVGRLCYCGSAIDYGKDDKEIERLAKSGKTTKKLTKLLELRAKRVRWQNVPFEIQELVTQAQLDGLAARLEELPFAERLSWLQAAERSGGDFEKLLISAVHQRCLNSYSDPEYAKDDRFIAQIPLDYRLCPSKNEAVAKTVEVAVPAKLGKDGEIKKKATTRLKQIKTEAIPRICGEARLLLDSDNSHYKTFLEISNPQPKGAAIRLPLRLSKERLARFCDESAGIGSLALAIGSGNFTVRGVAAKPEALLDLKSFTAIVGRDFNIKNTIALSAVRLTRKIVAADFEALAKLDKDAAKAYLESCHHPMNNISAQLLIDASGFLNHCASLCSKIDAISSEIACCYNKLEKIKRCISGYLQLQPGELISVDQVADDEFVAQLIVSFFSILKNITKLKAKRREHYARITRIKRTWHGHVANKERSFCRANNAFLVKEKLTYETIPADSPDYRGPTFNKLINLSARGQYERAASAKYEWDGIPEYSIPSFYTSSSCLKHSIVDASMRKGDVFCCPKCKSAEYADGHASATIANYVLATLRKSKK